MEIAYTNTTWRDGPDNPEKDMWLRVIFQAICDLDSEENPIKRTLDDSRIYINGKGSHYSVRYDAERFIAGIDGRLHTICEAIGINANSIISLYRKLGANKLKLMWESVELKKKQGQLND